MGRPVTSGPLLRPSDLFFEIEKGGGEGEEGWRGRGRKGGRKERGMERWRGEEKRWREEGEGERDFVKSSSICLVHLWNPLDKSTLVPQLKSFRSSTFRLPSFIRESCVVCEVPVSVVTSNFFHN